MTQNDDSITMVKRWLAEWVIGLNLCPFARKPFEQDTIRFVLDENQDPYVSLGVVLTEISRLKTGDYQTTLIVYPNQGSFEAFDDFITYCAAATDLLEQQHLDSDIQLASFHPEFVFSDATQSDPANQVNRSPFPILHLLRVADVEAAVRNHPDAANISFSNMRKLRMREAQKNAKA